MTAVLYGVAAALALVLGAVQFASDGIFASAGSAHSLPAHIRPSLGAAVYGVLARVAPAPFVESMLARAALQRGDLDAAQSYALRLPPSPWRSDLLGRIAHSRGDESAAQQYFLRAGDIFAIGDEIDALAERSPAAAYALQAELKNSLERSATHPDLVAEAYWRLGVLSARLGQPQRALSQYLRAIDLSPVNSKYLISAGFQSYDLHQNVPAQRFFARAIAVDPCSADALAGAGMVALRQGRRPAAQAYAARSASCNPASHALFTLRGQLQHG